MAEEPKMKITFEMSEDMLKGMLCKYTSSRECGDCPLNSTTGHICSVESAVGRLEIRDKLRSFFQTRNRPTR